MLIVSEATKTAYKSDSVNKEIRVYFPNLDILFTNDDVIQKSFSLEEKIMDGDSLEFVGCLSSIMKVELLNATDELVNERVEVYVKADGDDVDEIQLFTGTVQSAEKTTYRNRKKITAYDDFYRLGKLEATSWYNNHNDTTIQYLFEDLMEFCELEYADVSLINGDMPAWCSLTQSASAISALTILKSICQINAVWGVMTRDGRFTTKLPYDVSKQTTESIPYYKDCKVEEYRVKSPDTVIIRDSDSDGGYQYTEAEYPENKYIIQSNMFAFDFTQEESLKACENIYNLISKFSYVPYELDVNGLPYVECGDMVEVETYDGTTVTTQRFVVMLRQIGGIQAMRDNFEASGDENLSELISDIGTSLESLKAKLGEYSLVRYDYKNGRVIDLTDDWEVLFSIKYEAKLKVPFFIAELMLECVGDTFTKQSTNSMTMKQLVLDESGNVKEDTVTQDVSVESTESKESIAYFKYVLDEEEIEYYPQSQFCDGTHLMHLYYPMRNLNVAGGTFVVYAKKGNGNISIPIDGIHAGLIGQGKSTVGEWDGKLEFEEIMPHITVQSDIIVTKAVDNLYMDLITPVGDSFVERVRPISIFSDITVIPARDEFSDEDIKEIVKTATISTDYKDDYTYDTDYVLTDIKFELNTNYNGTTTEMSVDTGYMVKSSINLSQFASINNIEVE